jgi:O-acetyl-ADP-ribose deacetylase (regulator of RNase III)
MGRQSNFFAGQQRPLVGIIAECRMTTWAASVGNLLDLSADALICSANPQLNLSGGVGGALLLGYGDAMQVFLHDWLRQSGQRFVAPGTVACAPPCGSPYRVVLHAVAIDALYNTSAELISQTYATAFALASQHGCRTIASACLACGYGRASPEMFAAAMRTHWGRPLSGIERIELRSTNADIIAALATR